MKQIKVAVKSIKDQKALIERVQADIARCNETIAQGVGSDGSSEIGALREKRKGIVAQAYIDRAEPDTAEIDAQIEKLVADRARREHEIAAQRAEQQAAKDARSILSGQLVEAQQALETLADQQRSAVADYLMSAHDDAQKQYLDAVDSMAKPVEIMAAAERAWYAVMGRAEKFPGRGASVVRELREVGVRVPWDRSSLKDPSVAEEYDNYQDFWYVPEWAAANREGFGDADVARLLSEVRSAGVPVDVPVTQDKPAARRVEIEIVRGSVIGTKPGSIKRNPVDGSVIRSEQMEFGPGSRLTFPEPEADELVRMGIAKYTSAHDVERARQ